MLRFFLLSVSLQLAYTISVHLDDNQGALQHPELNIPSSGAIPRTVETFKVHLVCTGNVSKEVPVGIHLHVEGPPKQNDTKLIIKRNKICIKGECSFLHISRSVAFPPGSIQGVAVVVDVVCLHVPFDECKLLLLFSCGRIREGVSGLADEWSFHTLHWG